MSGFDYSTLPRTIDIPEKPITSLLIDAAAKYPNASAIHFFGTEITYAEFDRLVKKVMVVLKDLGVAKGVPVAIMSANCPQSLIAYQAIHRLGGIVVMTNPLYVEREIEHQFNDADVKIAVVLNLMADRVQNIIDKTSVEKVVVLKLQDFMSFPFNILFPIKLMVTKQSKKHPDDSRFLKWSDLMAAASGEVEHADVSPDDIALYQYTGGTTGVAKGVVLTHKNILANTLQCRAWFPGATEATEVFMLTLPVFHVFGMTVGMNLGISLAAKIILEPKFDAHRIMQQIEKHKATIFPGVPAMYVAINNHPKAGKCDISSIKYCISGAAPLLRETQHKFEKMTGGKLVEGYGLSEASPVTHANPLLGGGKEGSIGMSLPNTESRIVDGESGAELPLGEVGELAVKGPQVMKGYKGNPPGEAKTIRDGWLFTGDMGLMDEDGFVFLKDRKKEMIITGGFNVYPKEVEEILVKIDGVAEAAATGMPDEKFGEKVVACIVMKEGEKTTEADVIEFCKKDLTHYKVPKRVVFMHSLPKTIIGKILKRELKKQLETIL